MERKAFGKVRAVAGFVLRFLSSPNTYLVVGAWIYLEELESHADAAFFRGYFGNVLESRYWIAAAKWSKEALVLFGGMYAICRISRAIENLKAPTESKAPSPE